jgi:DNA-binding MltR family transcriptional regulator
MSAKVRKSKISDFTDLHQEWFDESPRGVILTAAAYLDDRLVDILKSFLRDNAGANKLLAGFNAPFGSFSSRVAAAYALGLISTAEYEKLELLREIRNKYAHEIKIKVTDEPVARLMSKFIKLSVDESWEPKLGHEEEEYILHFRVSAFAFLLSFVDKSALAGDFRLKEISWDDKIFPSDTD